VSGVLDKVAAFAEEIAGTITAGFAVHDATGESFDGLGRDVDILAKFPDGGGESGRIIGEAYIRATTANKQNAAVYTSFLDVANSLVGLVRKALDGLYDVLGDPRDPEIHVPENELPAAVRAAGDAGAIKIAKAAAPVPAGAEAMPQAVFWVPLIAVVTVAGLAAVLYSYFDSMKEKYGAQKAEIDRARLAAIQYAIDHGRPDVAKALAEKPLGGETKGAGGLATLGAGVGLGALAVGALVVFLLVKSK